ncbi:MAG: response regulator transcription factor [Solirubrobacteraceae bacterium]
MLEELRTIVPFRAAMLSAIDPLSHSPRTVVLENYTPRVAEYMRGDEFHRELVADRDAWPFRERDLPVDPLSIRAVAEYLRPAGLVEGMLAVLKSTGGRYVGFLIMSVEDVRHPSDRARSVVGHVAPALANLVDPLLDASRLASILAERETAVALLPDGTALALHGPECEELMDPESQLRRSVNAITTGARRTAAFLWPSSDGGWHSCRVYACRDGVTVVTASESVDLHGLTRRELEVLGHLVAGRANAEIAKDLWVTTRTVRAHVERILEKLEVRSRAGAVARAYSEGLLLP